MDDFRNSAAGYVTALKSCLQKHNKCLEKVKMIHSKAVTNQCCNMFVENTLVDVYAKCGAMVESRSVFNNMLTRNIISWNSLIHGYANNGQSELALEVFHAVELPPNARTYVAALAACGSLVGEKSKRWLETGKSIHSMARRHGFCTNKFVLNVLVDMYSKFGDMNEARKVFNSIADPDVVSWTSLMQGYVRNGDYTLALEAFDNMSCVQNERSFTVALKACTSGVSHAEGDRKKWLEKGKSIHRLVKLNHLYGSLYVQNTLVDLYSKCGSMEDAKHVFESIQHPDVVSWNALLQGYVDTGEPELALALYDRMKGDACLPDARTHVVALSACGALAARNNGSPGRRGERKICWLEKGKLIHSEIRCLDVFVETALINMYAKFGEMVEARKVFDKMAERNLVSWNSTIRGYIDNGESWLGLELVLDMLAEGMQCDSATFVAAIQACQELMAVEACKGLSCEVYKLGLEHDVRIVTCLMEFYSKSGNTSLTSHMFDSLALTDLWSWNSLLCGFSHQGKDSGNVFRVFQEMVDQGVCLNELTFTHVLNACSHAGLTNRGRNCFSSMTFRFGITPDIVHYNSLIDILARANYLEEAVEVAERMPFEANVVTWTGILSACQKWKNSSIGKLACESLLKLDDKDPTAYLLMANTF